jgi:DNA-directed RNA polymerase sigma subunit (sigma70/sigma32)
MPMSVSNFMQLTQSKHSSKNRINDEALNRMHANRVPGRSYTTTEIADAVGVSKQRIAAIEQAALVKVRRAMGASYLWL